MGELPRTSRERQLATIWEEVLSVTVSDREQDFFEIGGDSLLATIVSVTARQRIGIELTPTMMFANPVLADLCRELDRQQPDTTPIMQKSPRRTS
ncbi:phosphopantetheine-binding protein [Nocardia brasiliensis]|uniref:phosphopantetheine-binding protein n=1 Tax=Nocardia brasiliensis TaxID=37326 RepID=UPI00142DE5AD|nr:phosphopantetheine-binding protein [Nocardia brasiliensis]